MIIYPAIDIKDGKCVRLRQGRADCSTTYYENPLDAALLWKSMGANSLHIVDLDGAFKGKPCNMDRILEIKRKTGLFVEAGGGIRDKDTVKRLLDGGIDRVILGTAALFHEELVRWSALNYKGRAAVSVDTVEGMAAYNGWAGISAMKTIELIGSMIEKGIDTFIYTDIKRDGMLSGPDTSGIKSILKSFDVKLIASGGVTSLHDLKLLKEAKAYGAIIGKALYCGGIKLNEAVEDMACF